jgi:hypothetical protein
VGVNGDLAGGNREEARGGGVPRVSSPRPRWLLALGAAVGIALAVTSLLGPAESDSLPDGAVARVGEVLIRAREYERAVAALESDRRTPLTEADRRFVLDRLIDEELLVQYGLSLRLARSDRRIRSDFVAAVIAAQVASVDGYAPSEAEMRDFYRENRDFFRPPSRLRVRSLWVRGEPARSAPAALARAREAAARLRAGDDFAAVDAEWGDPQVAPVPDALLPSAKLREYLGPTALMVAQGLDVGGVSEPLVTESGARVLMSVAAEVPEQPPLVEVAEEVRSEMVRRAGDDALRRLLAELRSNAQLQVAGELP